METSLTREQFLQRFVDRRDEIKMPDTDKIQEKMKGLPPMIRHAGNEINIDLSPLLGIYLSEYLLNLLNVVYKE
jgi:hypothetical protein